MRAKHTPFFLAAAMMLFAASANGALWKFNVFMDGLQETPPVATPGSGTAMVLYNDVTGLMDVNGTFSGLIGNTTAAHVHGFAPAGTPAGVIFPLTVSPGTSGTVSGSGTIGDSASVLAGLTYINIHSTFRTGGEIRGQIAGPMLIPEPAAAALLAIGAAGMLASRRRSRRFA